MIPKIGIRVPGTSANLGPGFDILGMALDVYNDFVFRFPNLRSRESVLKSLEALPFSPDEDLVWKSYSDYFATYLPKEKPIPYHCTMDLGLPLKGGLGSSASAIVAGFCLGREVHKRKFPHLSQPVEREFLHHLALFEGHPDNTVPAYLGGWILATHMDQERFHFLQKKFPNQVSLFLFLPEYFIVTEESRKLLPTQYPTSEVIHNMGKIASWMQFMDKRKFSDLLEALEDKIHTPFRLMESPLAKIFDCFKSLGLGVCLSGSGPSLLVFCPRKDAKSIETKLKNELKDLVGSSFPYQFFRTKPNQTGVRIKIY